jgi:RHS repeat-associated protein
MQTTFIYDCTPRFVHLCVFSASRYTGKERDTESGHDYFKYRYYASSIGRWMSPDPSLLMHADPRNPQSLNLYSYVGNNPLSRVDLDGLCWKGFQWACDLGQAIDNSVHGFGFHTDDTVDKNVQKARQSLRAQGFSTEELTYKEILRVAKKPAEPGEPNQTITAATDP